MTFREEFDRLHISDEMMAFAPRWKQLRKEKGYIYFAAPVGFEPARVKIGYTTMAPSRRIKALQTGSPVKLDIVAYFDGFRLWEEVFHEHYSPYRAHGEWFDIRGDLKRALYELDAQATEDGLIGHDEAYEAIYGPLHRNELSAAERIRHISILKLAARVAR